MANLDLVLASTSPYRRELLKRLGLPFRVQAPLCDEERLKNPAMTPLELAEHLARAKASSLISTCPDGTILGSDQVATIAHGHQWRILGKPKTAERAVEQLSLLSGREHVLITALAVVHRGVVHCHVDQTRLHMRPLSTAQLKRYVAADQPLDCAGAYKLECQGISLFDAIESEDHSAIIGLPLIALTRILTTCGFQIP